MDENESEVVFDEEFRHGDVERITIQAGWLDLSDGYFCLLERDGICVEDFGSTRNSSLRYARRAWRKEKNKKDKKVQQEKGYPKVRKCS